MPVIKKCFKKLAKHHIKSRLSPTPDPLELAYRAKRYSEEAIAIAIHTAINHPEHRGSYATIALHLIS